MDSKSMPKLPGGSWREATEGVKAANSVKLT
jgi:hypothetical protein